MIVIFRWFDLSNERLDRGVNTLIRDIRIAAATLALDLRLAKGTDRDPRGQYALEPLAESDYAFWVVPGMLFDPKVMAEDIANDLQESFGLTVVVGSVD